MVVHSAQHVDKHSGKVSQATFIVANLALDSGTCYTEGVNCRIPMIAGGLNFGELHQDLHEREISHMSREGPNVCT